MNGVVQSSSAQPTNNMSALPPLGKVLESQWGCEEVASRSLAVRTTLVCERGCRTAASYTDADVNHLGFKLRVFFCDLLFNACLT